MSKTKGLSLTTAERQTRFRESQATKKLKELRGQWLNDEETLKAKNYISKIINKRPMQVIV